MTKVSTVVEVMKPTSLYQLGKGAKKIHPTTSVATSPAHGCREDRGRQYIPLGISCLTPEVESLAEP